MLLEVIPQHNKNSIDNTIGLLNNSECDTHTPMMGKV